MERFDPHRTVVIKDPTLRQFEGGFTALPNRILRNRDLSLGARMTYGMLLSYAWQKDFCHPAQERIAIDLGVTDRSVRTFLTELREAGLISWRHQGLNKPNVYTILRMPDGAHPAPAQSGPEIFSGPDRKPTSAQDRNPASDKEYPKKNTQYVNVTTNLPSPTDDEQHAFEEYLVSEIMAVCHDPHSKGFYRKLVRTVPRDVIDEALGETRYRAQIGEIRSTRGAFFTDYVQRRIADSSQLLQSGSAPLSRPHLQITKRNLLG